MNTKEKLDKIVAPKVDVGQPFKVISVYWFTTYVQMNPFMGTPRCKCGYPAVFYRFVGDLYGGAVSVNEFACIAGHRWESRQTHD